MELDMMSLVVSAISVLTPLMLILGIFMLIAACKLYVKAGQKWWEAIIPIYNGFIFLKIIKKSYWNFLLLLIPVINIIFSIIFTHNFSKKFGHGVGFTIGLLFFPIIFFPVLAFGKSTYEQAA